MDYFTSNNTASPLDGISSSLTILCVILILLPLLSGFILTIVAKWNIFEKAGENGWAALVPFYNRYVFYYITWGNGIYFLASLIPGVSYVMNVISMVKLSGCFGKNSVFTFGLVMWEPVFLAILGFDDSEYDY